MGINLRVCGEMADLRVLSAILLICEMQAAVPAVAFHTGSIRVGTIVETELRLFMLLDVHGTTLKLF